MRNFFLPFSLPLIGKEEKNEVMDTLNSCWITTGPKTKKFEQMLQKYTGAKHAIAVSSCTHALHLSLAAINIFPTDEVIVPVVTWPSTANVVVHLGAIPTFVDIDPNTFLIDIKQIESKITSRTKAIIPVHMAGLPVDMKKIYQIAEKHNLKVIEDAAHAIGAEYKGIKIGNIKGTTTTCFSFYAIKNITTIEGGAVLTDDDTISDRIRMLSLHGISKNAWKRYSDNDSIHWELIEPGYKCNMTDIQASLGIHQLNKLDHFIAIREKYAQLYDKAFKNIKEIITPKTKDYTKHAWHLYIIMIRTEMLKIRRDKFVELLRKNNIGTGIHFISLHLQKYYRERFGFKKDDFPNAAYTSERIVSLPIYPKMNEQDVKDVIVAVKRIIAHYRK